MQFMVSVILDPQKAKAPTPKELADAEAEAVRGLYMEGLIRQIWVYADGSGALMITEADSADAVAKTLAALPMVREGFLQAPQVAALAPYWGFGPRG